jgi:hypothetical protein
MYDVAFNPVDKIYRLIHARAVHAVVGRIMGQKHDQIATHNRDMGLEFRVVPSEGVQLNHCVVCRLVTFPVSKLQKANLDISPLVPKKFPWIHIYKEFLWIFEAEGETWI